ncbi:Aspartic endopeptidase [Sarracenia purpurea var. burkii]
MALVITSYSLSPLALAITVSIISLAEFLSIAGSTRAGFSMDLIHRDSPESPFYNHSLTPFEHVGHALRRSANRANYFKSASLSPQDASTEIIASDGEYLMKIAVGTPKFNLLALADTGSDLTWTQCSPCIRCYKQKARLFNPRMSSSYKDIPCRSRQCPPLQSAPGPLQRRSCSTNGSCAYSVSYGDRSFSRGVIGTETISLGSTTGRLVSLRGILFGCGYYNGGTFTENESGIVGLGGGRVSLVSQMRPSMGAKFSYCLVPNLSENRKPSQIYFGKNAAVVGDGVVSTPILPNFIKTFYYLGLEGFTVVGSRKLEILDDFSSSRFGGSRKVRIIIDSGTTMTYLPPDLYSRLAMAVRRAVKPPPVRDPLGILNLCYRYNASSALEAPNIIAHFTGADVELSPLNTFVRTGPTVACLAFVPAENVAIFGNVAQINFLVGYDLVKRTVSFKPTDCAIRRVGDT